MKPLIFSLLMMLAGITWWRLRSRRTRFFRVAVAAYLVIVAVRLAGNGIDQEQLQLIGFSFAFFAALWALAWFITRSAARSQAPNHKDTKNAKVHQTRGK